MRCLKQLIHYLCRIPNALIRRTLWWRQLFVDFDHKRYPDNVWYREHNERNFDCVNLGSSSAYWCFDYDRTGVRGMNWANVPQTLLDDFRLVQNFHSILKQGGRVLIVIMPFTGLNKAIGLMDVFKYVRTMDGTLLDERFRIEALRCYRMPLCFGWPALKAVIRHFLGKEHLRSLPLGATDEANPMDADELKDDAERWIAGWKRQFGIEDLDAPLTPKNLEGRKIRVDAMRRLIDFVTERGYEPVYVIPPVSAALAAQFTSVFKARYISSFLDEVNRPVRTLDYTDSCEWKDASLYFNSFFMNAKGRRRFTRRVLADLGYPVAP